MKHLRTILMAAAVVIVVVLSASLPRRIKSNHDVPTYATNSETTVTGMVDAVDEFPCPLSGGLGTHVALRTDSGTVVVHVAPAAFVADRQLRLARGDSIQVMGSKVWYAGESVIIAREIAWNEGVYILRDGSGNPLWTR